MTTLIMCFGHGSAEGQNYAYFRDFLCGLPVQTQCFQDGAGIYPWVMNHGPVQRGDGLILFGHSHGGCEVLSVARKLVDDGIQVDLLVTFGFVWKFLVGYGSYDVPANVLRAAAYWNQNDSLPVVDEQGISHPSDIWQNFPLPYRHCEYLTNPSMHAPLTAFVEEAIAERTALKFQRTLER